MLLSHFEDAMEADPGRVRPWLRIYDTQTGKEVRFIQQQPDWLGSELRQDDVSDGGS